MSEQENPQEEAQVEETKVEETVSAATDAAEAAAETVTETAEAAAETVTETAEAATEAATEAVAEASEATEAAAPESKNESAAAPAKPAAESRPSGRDSDDRRGGRRDDRRDDRRGGRRDDRRGGRRDDRKEVSNVYVSGPPAEYVRPQYRGRSRRVEGSINIKDVHYRNIPLLSKFLDPYGRIMSRRKTRVSAKVQRKAVKAIKQARHLCLLPYTGEHMRVARKRRRR